MFKHRKMRFNGEWSLLAGNRVYELKFYSSMNFKNIKFVYTLYVNNKTIKQDLFNSIIHTHRCYYRYKKIQIRPKIVEKL